MRKDIKIIISTIVLINSNGWKIYGEIAPNYKERIFKKYFNSAFKETKLKDYLDNKECLV